MKKSAHTPGPWNVYERKEWSKECGNGGEGFSSSYWVGAGETEWRGPGTIVDFVKPWSSLVVANRELVKEAKANAQLIAAAPEMLAALETISAAIDQYGDNLHNKLDGVQLVRDAIAKARGES